MSSRTATEISQAAWRDLLATRRSVRALGAEPIPRETLLTLVEAASWAPSPHNAEPWRFALVISAAGKHALAETMAARWRADLERDELPDAAIAARVQRSRSRLTGAAALVIACLITEGLDQYPDLPRQRAEREMAIQSLGAAVQNLLLAAAGLGLASCWMCAPIFCPETVRAGLDLPTAWEPQALVALGQPLADPPMPARLDPGQLSVIR